MTIVLACNLFNVLIDFLGSDFTFATTRGNHSPAFGTAGDCYSKTQCPQVGEISYFYDSKWSKRIPLDLKFNKLIVLTKSGVRTRKTWLLTFEGHVKAKTPGQKKQ